MILILDIPTDDKRHAAFACVSSIEAVVGFGMAEIGSLPPLYQSGVRYEVDPPGPQRILRPRQVFEKRTADCKSLIVYRLCELRAKCGERIAVPRIEWVRTGRGFRAHAVIRRADGSIECPSTILGM